MKTWNQQFSWKCLTMKKFGDTSIINAKIRWNEPTRETAKERKPSKVGNEKKENYSRRTKFSSKYPLSFWEPAKAIVLKQLYLFNKVKTVSSFVRALDVFPANWSNKDFLLSVSLHFSFCLLALCKHLIKRKGTSLISTAQKLQNFLDSSVLTLYVSSRHKGLCKV